MRAPGESIGTFALESAIDELAYELQMDPIEVRRINEPQRDPTRDTPFSSRHLTDGVTAWRGTIRMEGLQTRFSARRKMLGRAGHSDGVLSVSAFSREGAGSIVRGRVRGGADARERHGHGHGDGPDSACCRSSRLADASRQLSIWRSSLPDTPIWRAARIRPQTIFAAVREAVEQIHRELLKLAHKRSDSPLHGAKYEEVEARNGGLFRREDRASGETYAAVLQKSGQASVEAERRPVRRWSS